MHRGIDRKGIMLVLVSKCQLFFSLFVGPLHFLLSLLLFNSHTSLYSSALRFDSQLVLTVLYFNVIYIYMGLPTMIRSAF